MTCPHRSPDLGSCACTYVGSHGRCDKHGVCCECVAHHRKRGQLPGCFFPADAEATYDRSVRKFLEVQHGA